MVTLASRGGQVITNRPEGTGLYLWTINGSTLMPGTVVTCAGQTTPDVSPVDAAGETPLGIVVEYTDEHETTPDTVMTDNYRILVAMCGTGLTALVLAVTSRGAVVPGEFLMHGGDRMIQSTIAGALAADNLTTWLTAWNAIVGRAVDYDADVAAWDYIEVLLCH